MKKLLLVLVLIGGLIAVGSAVTRAGGSAGPNLMVSQSSGPAGFEFTATVTGCEDGEDVTFSVEGDASPTEFTTTCSGAPPTASADFTAPTTPGVYTVTGVLDPDEDGPLTNCFSDDDRPCSVSATIYVQPPPPSLEVSPDLGAPGFEFTMTVLDCGNVEGFLLVDVEQQRVPLEIDVDFYTFSGTEIDLDAPADEDLGVPCDFGETPTEAESKTFTAPDTPGVYPVLAIVNATEDFDSQPLGLADNGLPPPCDDFPMVFGEPTTALTVTSQCSLTGEITVEEEPEETTTTTAAPTTEPPEETTTTTAAPTTTIDEGAGVPAPTEPPVAELPATGTSGNSGTAALAILLLLAGGGLVVLGTRRRTSTEQR